MTGAPAVAVPFLAATLLLGGAGVAKLRRPEYTSLALAGAGLPAHRRLVRAGAAAEVAVAVAAVAVPGAFTGALVAASYAAFTAFVVVALRRGWVLSSCGCFGRPDSRPSWSHAALNALAMVAAGYWAASRPAPVTHLFEGTTPWSGFPLVLLTVVVTGLAYLVWNNPMAAVAA